MLCANLGHASTSSPGAPELHRLLERRIGLRRVVDRLCPRRGRPREGRRDRGHAEPSFAITRALRTRRTVGAGCRDRRSCDARLRARGLRARVRCVESVRRAAAAGAGAVARGASRGRRGDRGHGAAWAYDGGRGSRLRGAGTGRAGCRDDGPGWSTGTGAGPGWAGRRRGRRQRGGLGHRWRRRGGSRRRDVRAPSRTRSRPRRRRPARRGRAPAAGSAPARTRSSAVIGGIVATAPSGPGGPDRRRARRGGRRQHDAAA